MIVRNNRRTPRGLGDYDTWAASLGLENCDQNTVGGQYACSQRNDAKIQAWGSSPEQVAYQSQVAADEAATVATVLGTGAAVQSVQQFEQDNPNVTPQTISAVINPQTGPTVITTPNQTVQATQDQNTTVVQQAVQAAQQSYDNATQPVVTQSQDVQQSQQTQTQQTSNIPVGFALINKTTGAIHPSLFTVGDQFQIVITGPPNTPIQVSSSQNGISHGTANYSIDGSGNFAIGGTMDASTIGTWQETWIIGNNTVGISFSVAVPQSSNTQSQNQQVNSGGLAVTEVGTGAPLNTTNTTNNQLVPISTTTSFFDDFGTGISELFSPSDWSTVLESGNAGEILGLLAVPLAVGAFVMSQHKGRR